MTRHARHLARMRRARRRRRQTWVDGIRMGLDFGRKADVTVVLVYRAGEWHRL